MSGTIVDSLMAGVAGATDSVNGVLPTSAQVTANRTKTLRVVLGSDVSTMNGFSGSQGKLGGDGFNMAHNVFDSLLIVGYDKATTVAANGGNNTWLPNLLTSATPSANNTVWTCTVREGVTFSNGKPFTAANIVVAMTAAFADTTVGFAINPLLNSVTMTDSHTVVYTAALPWATFPIVLANSQIGFIAYPSTFLGDVVSDHASLIQSELDSGSFTTTGINAINALCPNGKASGGWSPSATSKVVGGGASGGYPIGTGPFTLASGDWTNNAGATFRRNPNYWKSDANGNRLPYVGTLTTKIQPDTGQQYGYLTAKSADVVYNTDGNYISKMATAYKSNFYVDTNAPYSHTVSCLMFNTLGESFFAGGMANHPVAGLGDGHDAGSAAVKDVRIRKAVAMAINLATFNKTVNNGLYPWGGTSANAIDGVFNPKSPY
jgi:ABC-type transport system substrate-binding protein